MKLSFTYPNLTITTNEKTTIDAILETFKISRKSRYFLYQEQRITRNGLALKQSCIVQENDCLQIDITPSDYEVIAKDDKEITVCYEDDVFLIVSKPSHLLVHSDGVNTQHTLSNRVATYYDRTHQACPVRPIHRLDFETSGLVMFCKLPFFQPLLDSMLAEKKIYREYDAFVKGTITKKKQRIALAIGRDRHDARKMRPSPNGKTALTDVTVKQVYATYTWIHCILHTGRTHQIRVHLSAIHHPLLADTLYGTKSPLIHRLALHASTISFYHPLEQRICHVHAPLPEDMKKLI